MGFRAALVLAAVVLPRTAALRPRIRGGLPRRRLEATPCPADDCCPAKLEPILASECPPPDSGNVARFSCDAPDLVVGNLCRSNAGECGTDKNLDNCEYPETKLKADIYRVVEARPVAPTAKPTSICPELVALEKDSPDCPPELDIEPCDTPGLTGFCEGDGECGTSKKLDNCACAGCGKNGAPITGADIYRIVSGDTPTPRPTKKPSTPKPTTSPDDCPSLEALPTGSPDCPAELDIIPCDTPGLVAGDFCEGDGECGTDKKLDNCACEACGKGSAPISGADIYRVVGDAPVDDDDAAPTDEDDAPVADDDDDAAPVDDDDEAPMDDDVAPADDDAAVDDTPDPIADDPDPVADDDTNGATAQPTNRPTNTGRIENVDTVLRFRPEELPDNYDKRNTVKRAVTESLVAAEIVPSEDDVLAIEWEPVQELPAGRRKLAESAPCRATLKVFPCQMNVICRPEEDAVAMVAERVEAAAESGALGEALTNSGVPALGSAFDAAATAANAAADTAISDPDGGAAPTPRPSDAPTSSPGGSKKKKKKSGHEFPVWAIIVIIVGGVGCCVCLFAAASGLATGGTKKQKPRASSYKLEAGKRPPPPDSDSDSEKPAAAVSRALEKLDDEEEGPPPYDFTPDKAKPAKHRSSVEVDELWPSAAGGAAAGAAAESKAADGDMDCDSDSDLGSRISLHAPM